MLSIRGLWKVLVALGCCVLVLVPGAVLGDEDEEYMRDRGSRTFFRDPARGYPSTVIEVSGTGCSEGEVPFEQPYDHAAVGMTDGAGDFTLVRRYPINRDGTWGGEFPVPNAAQPGAYKLSAWCQADDMLFISGEASFRVLSRDPPATPRVVDPSPPPTLSPPTLSPTSSAIQDPAPTPPVMVVGEEEEELPRMSPPTPVPADLTEALGSDVPTWPGPRSGWLQVVAVVTFAGSVAVVVARRSKVVTYR